MTVDQKAVPSFDVPLTLPTVRILERTASNVLETWETKKNPTPIWRLGFVSQFFAKLSRSANQHIVDKYIRSDMIKDTWDINVNFLHRFRMETREVNRWMKIRPIRNRKDPGDDSAMVVEIDINTMQEQQDELSQEEIDVFYEDAYLHVINQDVKKIILE